MESRDERIRIVLEVEPETEPITGTIAAGAEEARPFEGLMQLVAALDELRVNEAVSKTAAD